MRHPLFQKCLLLLIIGMLLMIPLRIILLNMQLRLIQTQLYLEPSMVIQELLLL